MSAPFGPFVLTLDDIAKRMRSIFEGFTDPRKGKNTTYTLGDAALSAFSVFFMQSPSFLEYQHSLEQTQGENNAQTLFGAHDIPSDNHIRTLLDATDPTPVEPLFSYLFSALEQAGVVDSDRSVGGAVRLALDETEYFSSPPIPCEHCSTRRHANGKVTYFHSALTPVLVKPGCDKVLPLAPEFIRAQDAIVDAWLEYLQRGGAVHSVARTRWTGKRRETDTYRYAESVPLRDGDDALPVNRCELTTTDENGKVLYHNTFATSLGLADNNVAEVVAAGRSRWKSENENNNTLKTKGYHFEHNYGHGQRHLSSLLASLIILAFLTHTVLEWMHSKYHQLRRKLPSRKRPFNDIRTLTGYLCFDSWEALMDFMLKNFDPLLLEPKTG